MSGRKYAVEIFDLQPGIWQPIVAPIDCNTFWIENPAAAIRECTDNAPDQNSRYKVIRASTLQYLPTYLANTYGLDPASINNWRVRFTAGDLVTNVMPDAGAVTVAVTFIL